MSETTVIKVAMSKNFEVTNEYGVTFILNENAHKKYKQAVETHKQAVLEKLQRIEKWIANAHIPTFDLRATAD